VGNALIVRDRARESSLRQELAARVGSIPAVLEGDEAYDFLWDVLPTLGPGWVALGTENLRRHRTAGTLQARVRVPSDIDWFDLKLAFVTADGQTVEAREILASWAAGRRYHKLADGTVARLPMEWLSRRGTVAEELESLRQPGQGLGAFAAPLVAELLDEAEGDTARWTELLSRLRGIEGVPTRPVPPGLKGELRHYQLAGFRWMCFLRDLGLGACLADDMGLGKTIQCLAALLDTHRPGGVPAPGPPSIVVAPTSVLQNWAIEAGRFAPDLKVLIHHGPLRSTAAFEGVDLVLTTYALLRNDAEHLGQCPWRYVVLDEAQQTKNPDSQVARAARSLDARHRLALTGTPLENHTGELWSLFQYLMPGFFGRRGDFQKRYQVPIERARDGDALAGLRRRLRPFVLRRLKVEVAPELPPRQEQLLYCDMGPAQRALYEQVKDTYRESVFNAVAARGVRGATVSVLEALMRLRQCCCDPGLLPYPEAKTLNESAKTELLITLLSETIENGHRSLVFSQWPSLLKRLEPLLVERGWAYLYLDGSTRDRQDLVERFNAPDGPPLFLVSLKAGGSGLNLVGADHVIHLDPWWNPAVEDQATDRAHRIGQTRPVVAYKLVARNTVEEKILELQSRKRDLFDATVDAGRLSVAELTRADLEAVFAPGNDELEDRPMAAPPPKARSEAAEPPPIRVSDLPREREADELLRPGSRLTNASVRSATGWDAAYARAWLREQVEEGRLEKRGQKRGTWYRVLS
jgi:superfamily II DNA or RNA helicase